MAEKSPSASDWRNRANLGPGFTSQEVPDLGDHGGRDQEFPVGGVHVGEQANARQVVGIIGQRGGDQRAGVADDHAGRPNPSSSSSSDRAATSGVLP